MLNYRNTLVLFVLVIAVLVVRDISGPLSPVWYAGIILVLVILLTLGSVYIKMGFYLNSYCSGNPEKREVALTFDDGPDNMNTPLILDILKENGIRAAFFVIGTSVDGNSELIRRMDLEGHIIGGHSYSHHFFFDLLPAGKMKNELKRTADLILEITGKKMRLFRPPYGVTNPALARAVRSLDYLCIGWSLKSKDTVISDPDVLLDRLKTRVKPGDVILFHDTMKVTLELLPVFIACLKEQNYRIVEPERLLNIKAYDDAS
jgi:peptidoglycan-N-acetylglucosamine deacetylase